ncbi:MAG: hypothetical protein WD005_00325 [Haliea sp.]
MIEAIKQLAPATLLLVALSGQAQQPASANASESAPWDITGYWVSLVTEDWRFRMTTAPAGDYQGIPLTASARETANAWDPEADTAAGDQCKAYGAGGIMRMPTRLNISWVDGNVLRIDTDAGMQTRLLKFGSARDNAGAGSLQGVSHAAWILERTGGSRTEVVSGALEVSTTDMAPGYFRRNGLPYGENAELTEYFERVVQDNGDEYLIVISVLEDPANVTQAVITSSNFKREPDGANWDPADCIAQ